MQISVKWIHRVTLCCCLCLAMRLLSVRNVRLGSQVKWKRWTRDRKTWFRDWGYDGTLKIGNARATLDETNFRGKWMHYCDMEYCWHLEFFFIELLFQIVQVKEAIFFSLFSKVSHVFMQISAMIIISLERF